MLVPLSSDDARRLRDFIRDANFTHERFRTKPALREFPGRHGHLESLLEGVPEPTALNMLLRWFLLGVPQGAQEVGGLLPESILRIMLAGGLLQVENGNRLVPNVLLTPWDEYLFAADTAARMHSEHAEDVVLWPNPTTRLLQQFAIRRNSRDTLDLGAGCGMQGILAAAYSERVCTTDLNHRAEEFVVFNAHLNNVNNVKYYNGDTFEPVQERQFDLILANPPFFVTPSSGQLYCENDMELDQYCRRVVREAAQHLTDGGYFQAVLEWVQVRGEPWQERLSGWLEGTNCDAWILRGYARSPAAYAQQRIKESWSHLEFSSKFDEWMAYYRERGVEEIHGGLFAMRRRSGKNWLRIEEMPIDPADPFGDTVLEVFATQDILSSQPSDDELLGMKPRLSTHAQLEQNSRVVDGRWAASSQLLRLAGGVPASQAVEKEVAEFLAQCDGVKTLEELAQALSAKVSVSPDQVRQQCCAIVRRLAQQRFLQISR
jgi:methylase of polypeptide subunit release factors